MRNFDLSKVYQPSPRQQAFHNSKAKYRLYGGAVGGGKTHAIVFEAIGRSLAYDFPVSGAIFRRSFPELDSTIVRKMQEILPPWLYKYNQQKHVVTLSNGSTIDFGYAETDGDVTRYQSREWDWLGIDELTHFCVTPDTEILTDKGWKNITECKGDKAMSLSKNNELEFQPIEALHEFDFNGKLKDFYQRKGVSFTVTPNHKQIVERKDGWEFVRTDRLPRYTRLKRGGRWRGNPVQTRAFSHEYRGHNEIDSADMGDWLEFLGWYLADGYSFCMRGDKSPVVGIRQMKRVKSLEEVLERLGWRWKYNEDGKYEIFSRQLYEVVHPFGNTYTKRVPRGIMNLDTENLQRFLDGFIGGDGHLGKKEGAISIGLANEGLVDDLQEIALRLGYVSTKGYSKTKTGFDVYRLSLSRRQLEASQIDTSKMKDIEYNGKVYCPTVRKNHNFVMRHRGRVMITGNTEYKFTYLMSRVRTTKDLDVKFFAGTNPGDVGHTWVKSRWIDKDCKEPGYNPDEYDFISAKIQDNKFIMEANPDYIKQLEMLPENQRRALLYGDWDVFEGQFFEEWDEQRHVVKPFKVPGNWRFIMSMDDGTRAPRSAHVWAIDNDRRVWCVWEYYRKGEVLPDAAENMKESLKNAGLWNKIEYLVVDPSMKRANDQTGLSGTEILEGMGFGFKYGEIKLGNNKRVDGWKIVKSYLAHKPYQEPMLKFFSSCENIVRTIPNQIYYVGRNSKKEDLDTTQEDHAADDCRYALTSLDMLPSRFETGHGGSFEVMGRKYSPIHK